MGNWRITTLRLGRRTEWTRPSSMPMRAGARDMALSAYAEAARFYHMALAGP